MTTVLRFMFRLLILLNVGVIKQCLQRSMQGANRQVQKPYTQPSNAFHADEHPEIPRVRRASLNLDNQPTNPSPGSEFIQDVADDEDVISQNITRTDKISVTANRRSSSSTVYSPPDRKSVV